MPGGGSLGQSSTARSSALPAPQASRECESPGPLPTVAVGDTPSLLFYHQAGVPGVDGRPVGETDAGLT